MKSTLTRLLACTFLLAIFSCNNEKTEKKDQEPTTVSPAPSKDADSKKTEISVGPDGGSVKTKDVNVKMNTRDTTKH